MKENIIAEKSKAFALRVIKLYQYLCDKKKEYVISKQILRSGTSIGANVKEAICGQSKADFYAKMYIAYKEASETEYWLEIFAEAGLADREVVRALYRQCGTIRRILVASIRKTCSSKQRIH